jgi:hypothetical protein
MAFKMRGFTPFTKINGDDKKFNIVIDNKSDTISNDRDKNVCLPTNLNCPIDRKRIGKDMLRAIKPNKNVKNVKKVNPKKNK